MSDSTTPPPPTTVDASWLTGHRGSSILAAFNPLSRRWEEVCPEAELGDDTPVTLFWSERLGRYVTVLGAS